MQIIKFIERKAILEMQTEYQKKRINQLKHDRETEDEIIDKINAMSGDERLVELLRHGETRQHL